MSRLSGIRGRMPRAGAEDGFIIIIVMVLLMIVLLVGAAALAESLAARDSASRSARSARALQAADAGLQSGLYQLNQLNLGALALSDGGSLSSIITQLDTCPVPEVNGSGSVDGLTFTAIAAVGDACPLNTGSGVNGHATNLIPVGDHAYYELDFTPGTNALGDFTQFDPTIVAIGEDDGGGNSDVGNVYRRVEAILAPVDPFRTLEAEDNLTITVPSALSVGGTAIAGATAFNGTAAAGNNLTIQGQAALANTFTASNISSGGVTEPSALDYCGTLADGTPQHVTVNLAAGNITHVTSGCTGQLVNRPTISLSSSKADCAPDTGVVVCSTLFSSTIYPNTAASPDSIYCTTLCSALTFQPGDYVFCDFQYNGTVDLDPTATQAVRIFIDSPSSSRCSGHGTHTTSGITGFQTTYGNFVATHGVTNSLGLLRPSAAQVYIVGNGTNDGTSAYVTGDSTISSQDLFLYAPSSSVTVDGGETCVLSGTDCTNSGTIAGAVVGYDVSVSGTGVTEDLGLLNYPLSSSLGPFYVQQYIECDPVNSMPAVPTSGC